MFPHYLRPRRISGGGGVGGENAHRYFLSDDDDEWETFSFVKYKFFSMGGIDNYTAFERERLFDETGGFSSWFLSESSVLGETSNLSSIPVVEWKRNWIAIIRFLLICWTSWWRRTCSNTRT